MTCTRIDDSLWWAFCSVVSSVCVDACVKSKRDGDTAGVLFCACSARDWR